MALAITTQDTLWQFGSWFAGARGRETQGHAKPVRLDASAVEIQLLADTSQKSVFIHPFLGLADVARVVVEDMGGTYSAEETIFQVPNCQDVGGVLLAPPYVEGCSPGILDDLCSRVRPGGVELCVCLQRGVLAMMHVLDDPKALTAMHDDLCKVHGAAFRRNFCEVEITTALFNLRSPVGVGELVEDTAQGQFDALKALEGVAGMRLVACSLESIIPRHGPSTASDFETRTGLPRDHMTCHSLGLTIT